MTRKLLAGLVAGISILTAVPAQAASCPSLRYQIADINQTAADLAADNPGSALIFGGCILTAMNDYDRRHDAANARATLVACAGTSCVLTGDWSNCISVNVRLLAYALQVATLKESMGYC